MHLVLSLSWLLTLTRQPWSVLILGLRTAGFASRMQQLFPLLLDSLQTSVDGSVDIMKRIISGTHIDAGAVIEQMIKDVKKVDEPIPDRDFNPDPSPSLVRLGKSSLRSSVPSQPSRRLSWR